MRHRAPRPIIDLWRRLPRATARPLGKVAEWNPVRALAALMAVLCLGTGAYAAVAAVVGGSSTDDPAPTAGGDRSGLTVSRSGERPEFTPMPRSAAPTPEPRASAATSAPPAPEPLGVASASAPAVSVPPTPRLELDATTGTTASTSPTDRSGATSSPAPEDDTPPNTSLVEELLDDSVLFSFSANESASFTCSLDGAAYSACGSPTRYVGLDAGWHTFAVRATDAAGNVDPTPAEIRWLASEGHAALP